MTYLKRSDASPNVEVVPGMMTALKAAEERGPNEFCVFRFEADQTKQPCWGEEQYCDETEDGDMIQSCEGHFWWSLCRSPEWNIANYTPEPK
jgi:hypothetical protein